MRFVSVLSAVLALGVVGPVTASPVHYKREIYGKFTVPGGSLTPDADVGRTSAAAEVDTATTTISNINGSTTTTTFYVPADATATAEESMDAAAIAVTTTTSATSTTITTTTTITTSAIDISPTTIKFTVPAESLTPDADIGQTSAAAEAIDSFNPDLPNTIVKYIPPQATQPVDGSTEDLTTSATTDVSETTDIEATATLTWDGQTTAADYVPVTEPAESELEPYTESSTSAATVPETSAGSESTEVKAIATLTWDGQTTAYDYVPVTEPAESELEPYTESSTFAAIVTETSAESDDYDKHPQPTGVYSSDGDEETTTLVPGIDGEETTTFKQQMQQMHNDYDSFATPVPAYDNDTNTTPAATLTSSYDLTNPTAGSYSSEWYSTSTIYETEPTYTPEQSYGTGSTHAATPAFPAPGYAKPSINVETSATEGVTYDVQDTTPAVTVAETGYDKAAQPTAQSGYDVPKAVEKKKCHKKRPVGY
ncbi:hypothetical protein HDV00_008981 [Rhizophlyctis rosea]|nr:hypothetical protein HDV00_008981 [Rhizophlyctis rosea]